MINMKNRQKIWRIISVLMAVLCCVNLIYLYSEKYDIKQGSKVLYNVDRLTVEDTEIKSTFKSCVSAKDDETGQVEVKYKKLYGIEHVADYQLDKDGGIEVDFLDGDSAKILIFDEDGTQRFYEEVSQLNYEPGESGKYSIYIVGDKFTGKATFSSY